MLFYFQKEIRALAHTMAKVGSSMTKLDALNVGQIIRAKYDHGNLTNPSL